MSRTAVVIVSLGGIFAIAISMAGAGWLHLIVQGRSDREETRFTVVVPEMVPPQSPRESPTRTVTYIYRTAETGARDATSGPGTGSLHR